MVSRRLEPHVPDLGVRALSTAGLYTFFQSAVLKGATQASNVTALDKDGEVAVAVKNNQAGIGYVGLANSGPGSGVRRLSLNGQPCAPRPSRG